MCPKKVERSELHQWQGVAQWKSPGLLSNTASHLFKFSLTFDFIIKFQFRKSKLIVVLNYYLAKERGPLWYNNLSLPNQKNCPLFSYFISKIPKSELNSWSLVIGGRLDCALSTTCTALSLPVLYLWTVCCTLLAELSPSWTPITTHVNGAISTWCGAPSPVDR